MPARPKSRITTACNSCRMRKQKVRTPSSRTWLILQCSGNRPTCIQCLEHRRTCNWPEQLKRGPAKGYIETLEHRLQQTEALLLGLLSQVSDSQLADSAVIPHEPSATEQLRPGKRGTGSEYWKRFPLGSVEEIRSWQRDCQGSTPDADPIERPPTPDGDSTDLPTVQADAPQMSQQRASPEPRPSMWSGAPSVNFQQQFLW
ncbi:hypothetical protein BJX99DRAFT_114064 [Aspergillus californicus]